MAEGMCNPKVIILCGAGASNGSGGLSKSPPNGKTLFHDLCREFPSWRKIPTAFSVFFNQHFEEGMDHLLRGSYDLCRLNKDMAIFFSNFKIVNHFENLYWHLINTYQHSFESKEIIFATINYDCLIELASCRSRLPFHYFGNGKGLKILKIHGSCNFILSGVQGNGLQIFGPARVEGSIRVINPNQVEYAMNTTPFPPAMSLYSKGKEVLVAPNEIQPIVDEFNDLVNKAKLVIIIGIKPNPTDTHIWDSLSKTNAKILLVGNKAECLDWNSTFRKEKDAIWLSNRFSNAFEEICNYIDEILKK